MAITVGADQIGSLIGRFQPEPPNFGEDVAWRGQLILENSSLNDRQKLPLQRSMMPLSPPPQPFD